METSPVKSDALGAMEKTPCDTFRPKLPVAAAGLRMEPPPSVAYDCGSAPVPSSPHFQTEEPLVVKVVPRGLLVM